MKQFYCLAALFILAGCQAEINPEIRAEKPSIKAVTEHFTPTRTSIDSDRQVIWSAGDCIAVFPKKNRAEKYEIASGMGTANASFNYVSSDSGTSSDIDKNIAIYPYQENLTITGNDVQNVVCPSQQTYCANSVPNAALIMAAVSDDQSFGFKNVSGALKLSLKGICRVKSITVKGNNNETIAGTMSVDLTAPATPVFVTQSGIDTIVLDCGADGVQLNEDTATDFIVALPPVSFTNGFTITITGANGGTDTLATNKNNSVRRNTILAMPERSLEMTDGESRDLSRAGSASSNCYVVSNAGKYKFITVKGHDVAQTISATTASVLWESFGTATAPAVGDLVKNVNVEGDYIYFEATDKKGNALIAAKDATGKILWSWHIWLTDEPQAQTYYNGSVMMDRNLGATSVAEKEIGMIGLLYQWGRKDPFPASSDFARNGSGPVAASTTVWQVATTAVNKDENPTCYIDLTPTVADWGPVKTIYDPCPSGWKVPESTDVWMVGNQGPSGSYSMDNIYYYHTNFKNKWGDDDIFYPFAGYGWNVNNAYIIHNNEQRSYCWTVDRHGNPSKKACLEIHLGTASSSGCPTMYALSVRCQKIVTTP